jgi:quercetin dioxygenase-like cupin family protein
MQLPDRVRLPFTFDPQLLARDLKGLRTFAWISHFVRQNYEGDWSVIPLRGKAGAAHPVMMIYSDPACRDFADTPMLEACPYYRHVLGSFAAPLQAVRLMRLAPGSVIKEHADNDLSVEAGTVRLHIPVVTNPQVEFYLNRRRVELEAGSCWYLRLSDPHSVVNNGNADRVHMVIDAAVNEWVTSLLQLEAVCSARNG